MEPSHDLVPQRKLTLDQCIAAWLAAKSRRTGSIQTERAYSAVIKGFRAVLQSAGLDLDSDATLIAVLAQGWADRNQDGGLVSSSTYNQRLSILSSFYRYAVPRKLAMSNPIDLVERRPRQTVHAALPLEAEYVAEKLRAIPRRDVSDLRDYALLSLWFTTGRRVAELAALRCADLHFARRKMVVTWRHCKGGKVMTDELEPEVAGALMAYLRAVYGADLGSLASDAPIWVSLSHNNHGGAISTQAIADICEARLGVKQSHALRHSFAVAMDDAGASLSEIGERLGHENLKTTSDYMKRQRRARNRYAAKLVNMFGIE